MALTRTYQCPGCGKLYPTKKDPTKYFICPECGHRGLISKHSVATPMNVAQKKRAKGKELATKADQKPQAPFSKEELLGRTEVAQKPEEKTDETTYECDSCGAKVAKGQKFCPGCGKELDWSKVGS